MSLAESDHDSYDSNSEPMSEQETGNEEQRIQQWQAESDLDASLDEASDIASEDEIQAAISTLPLAALAKAKRAIQQSQFGSKAKGKGKETQDADDDVKQQAKEALASLKVARKGRQNPRLPSAVTASSSTSARVFEKPKETRHRPNKHAPMEMSTKRAVTRHRQVVDVPKVMVRDPRFDGLSGAFQKDTFNTTYGFLNDTRRAEVAKLRDAVKKARKNANMSNRDKEALESELVKASSQLAQLEKEEREAQAIKKWKETEKQKQEQGKKPFHLKRSQKKALFAEAKMEELSKDKKKLRKHQQRQEKRQSAKERKAMPTARVGF